MPDLTPPAGAAHDSHALLLWLVGLLILVCVYLGTQLMKAGARENAHLKDQIEQKGKDVAILEANTASNVEMRSAFDAWSEKMGGLSTAIKHCRFPNDDVA